MPNNRRRGGKRRPATNPSTMVHRIKRTTSSAFIPGAADTLSALTFNLSSLPDVGDFANLFDQYCIERVDVTIRVPRCAQPATTGEVFPFLTWALDYNDGTAPASLDAIRSYDSCRIHQFGEGTARSAKWSIIPKFNQSSTGGTFQSANKLWLNTADLTQAWHGIKYGLTYYNTGSFNNTVVWLDVVYHVALRHPK